MEPVLLPFSGGADQSVSHQAKPEVYNEAPIRLKWPVARQVQRWTEKEVGHISQNHGE